MATWNKLFSFFTWKNRPDTSTPLGQTLLNRLNTALNGIDDRVVTLNAEKASTEDLNGSIVNVSLNSSTGVFTFTKYDGTTFTINTALEEVVTNFVYDYATQSLVLTLADGTTQNIDLSALITQYEFTSSATILFTVGTDGKVTANIKPNSITDQMLQTNYLADITTQANTAVSASQSALESQSLAEQSAEEAKEQADRAESAADRAESVVGFTIDTTLSTESTNPIANKAVAVEFGKYLPKEGGKIKGDVTQEKDRDSAISKYLKNTNRTIREYVDGSGNYKVYDETNSKDIIVSTADGTNAFNGTASGNLSNKGGIVNGNITLDAGSYVTAYKANRTQSDGSVYGAQIWGGADKSALIGLYNADTNSVISFLAIHENDIKVSFNDSQKTIFHSGNKPTGSYTGNGDASERVIETGGIGTMLYLRATAYSAIVLESGAIVLKSDGTIQYIPYQQTTFKNGKLTLKTDGVLNTNGTVFTYTVH